MTRYFGRAPDVSLADAEQRIALGGRIVGRPGLGRLELGEVGRRGRAGRERAVEPFAEPPRGVAEPAAPATARGRAKIKYRSGPAGIYR